MGFCFHVYFLSAMLFCSAIGEEQHCSRYHYEAQTLERIIRTEFSLDAVKHDVELIKDGMKRGKLENEEGRTVFEERLDRLQEMFDDLVNNVTLKDDKKKSLVTPSMRQFCTTNSTCSDVENSECKWMACKCKPGLSYHHSTNRCLSDCGDFGYGDTYQVEMDAVLSGFATKTLKSVSLEECVQKCTTEMEFICRSAEYEKKKKTCYLSWETLHTNPDAHIKDRQDYVIYTRDCRS